jgi:hypothetical protein
MESLNFDYTTMIIVALLVSIGRIVTVLFGTLKVCVKEYYEFRRCVRAARSDAALPRSKGQETQRGS